LTSHPMMDNNDIQTKRIINIILYNATQWQNSYVGLCLIAMWHNLKNTSSNFLGKTSIDVLPSKNQALCEYCTHVSKLKDC